MAAGALSTQLANISRLNRLLAGFKRSGKSDVGVVIAPGHGRHSGVPEQIRIAGSVDEHLCHTARIPRLVEDNYVVNVPACCLHIGHNRIKPNIHSKSRQQLAQNQRKNRRGIAAGQTPCRFSLPWLAILPFGRGWYRSRIGSRGAEIPPPCPE